MYQILLVDDEPLILSGIKFMLDWEKLGCQVVDTARNGQQALEKIRALRPDIVICDIAMPGKTGIEVLQQVSVEAPDVVFIMLTNHPDFHLAQKSLRYRAVDYLLKTDLDAVALERSLRHAIDECASRAKLARVTLVDDYLESNRRTLLENAFLAVLKARPGAADHSGAGVLAQHGVLSGYAVAYLPLQFDAGNAGDAAERTRLLAWVREICEKMAANQFSHFAVFPAQSDALILLCWELSEQEWPARMRAYAEKVAPSCATITQTRLRVMATGWFAGADDLDRCREQIFALRDHYYMGSPGLFCGELPDIQWGRLALSGIASRLTAEIHAKNATACGLLLDRAIERVRTVPHQQSQALWLCGEIYGAVAGTMGIDNEEGRQNIERLATRDQVLQWLENIKTELTDRLGLNAQDGHSALIEKARQYVQDNVEKRIMLQDVANHICISPGYLSALFKKQYNQNFVDYINQVKTERACELIREGKYRIYEISYMLGFENAYYFTRVFKRYTGMTPTEYQKQQRGTNN